MAGFGACERSALWLVKPVINNVMDNKHQLINIIITVDIMILVH